MEEEAEILKEAVEFARRNLHRPGPLDCERQEAGRKTAWPLKYVFIVASIERLPNNELAR